MAKTTSKSRGTVETDRRALFRHTLVVPMACRREGARGPVSLVPAKLTLSGTGIRFPTTEFFRVGNRVEVTLALLGGDPTQLTVEILQIHPDGTNDSGYVVSGRFVGLPRRHQERLIQFLLRSQASYVQEARKA